MARRMSVRCATEGEPALHARLAARPSRVGRWRALVLLAVHVAIGLHAWHWYSTGRTLSPLEPSESMAFSQRGIVNAGLIFFASAILSTLLLGRWFCGWGCHLVAVQDGVRWLLGKAGIHPRPLHLGILASVPWLAFVYMFLSPIVLSLLEGAGFAPTGTSLSTEEFWRTFPSWPLAILSVLVCGVVIIWLLGAKGFCTYGCPYGAIFGIADQFAPLRIRVTDDCAHCGHCTTACSSNVNVSQEVRDWGMVVDPGCMKCADCVSVCPKDALYVGWGAPALLARRRTEPRRPRRREFARAGLLLAFMLLAYLLMHAFDGRYGAYTVHLDATLWKLVALLGAGSFAVALLLRGKARHAPEASLGEEFVLAACFLAALFAFRGFAGNTPLLLTLAIAAMFAFVGLQGWRLALRPDLAWKQWRLKSSGRLTAAGAVFAAFALCAAAGTGAAAWQQQRASSHWDERFAAARAALLEGTQAGCERAVELDPLSFQAHKRLAGKLYEAHELARCLEHCRLALELVPRDAEVHVLAALACEGLGDPQRARELLQGALTIDPGLEVARELLRALDKP